MKEHVLIIYKTKDNGELLSKALWKFEVSPTIKCTGVTDELRDGRIVPYDARPSELRAATTSIREFLFKQKSVPFQPQGTVMRAWAIEPALDEDEWVDVRKQAIIQEL